MEEFKGGLNLKIDSTTTLLRHYIKTNHNNNMFLNIYRLTSCRNTYKNSITYCNLNAKKDGHIYVVKEREFIKTNENIYKIGRSKNIVRRMPSYPKDSLIYSIMYSQNVVES